jgi:hypothetical protein
MPSKATRIYPKRISDKMALSRLLEQYLAVLAEPPLSADVQKLAYEVQIPANILLRLASVHRNPEDAPGIEVQDFHTVFSNVMIRFPALKIWRMEDGAIFFEK